MMEQISPKHILVASVTQSVLLLFLFFGLGLEKGAAAIAGNLIGAKKFDEVKRLFKSGIKLSLMFGVCLLVTLGIFSDGFISLFFKNPEALSGSMINISPELLIEVKSSLKTGLLMLVLYLTLENARWLLSGLLTSAGDTFYLMVTGAFSIWVFMLLPTYLFVYRVNGSIESTFFIWIFYCVISAALLYFRFWQGKWKEKKLIESEESVNSVQLTSSHAPSIASSEDGYDGE